ncbi:MAG: hypothetical protein ACFFFT_15200 [Candidatus Thorarchaeota archaeon]
MIDSIDNAKLEIDNYLRIIDYFQERKLNNESNEIRKFQSYIELVNTFKRTQNRNQFSNEIILMLALFEEMSPDSSHTSEDNIDQLSKREKNRFIEILKNEFLH